MDNALIKEAIDQVLETEAIAQRLDPSAADSLRRRLRDEAWRFVWRGVPEFDRLTDAYVELARHGGTPREEEVLDGIRAKVRELEAAQASAVTREREMRADINVTRAENAAARALAPPKPAPRRRSIFRRRAEQDQGERAYVIAMEELQEQKKRIADLVTTKYRLRMEVHRLAYDLAMRTSREVDVSAHPAVTAAIENMQRARADAVPAAIRELLLVAETWLQTHEARATEQPVPVHTEDAPAATPEPPPDATVVDIHASRPIEPGAVPTAFVSWAHGHRDQDPAERATWRHTLLAFTNALRVHGGIDADVDLFHEHRHDVNWQMYGPQAIEDHEYVILAASRAYRERWDGRNPATEGAGSAREANVLKTLFDEDQALFRRKVKVVVLPGTSEDDVPRELRGLARFRIGSFEQEGLEDLVRTLTEQPRYMKSPIGERPSLPPINP